MNTGKVKISFFAWALTGAILVGCDIGTRPGETNVERSEIVDEGELISDEDTVNRYSDTANLEKYYDHADHENHGDNKEGSAVHAGDGKGEGVERDDLQD